MTSIKSVQMEGEKFPLLGVKKRQSSVSPSPLQSWKDIVAEIRGPQRIWLLTLVTFIASLTTLLAGYTLGYPSSALLELSELPDEYAFTNETILPDLFGSFAPLGALFGSSIAGWTADGLGRKPALIISSIPNLNGWLLLALAQNWKSPAGFKTLILIGRFFTGFAMGWTLVCAPMYNAEIATATLRGIYNPSLLVAFGVFLIYLFGWIPQLSYVDNAVIAVGITAIYTFLCLFIPETPRYLVSKGRNEEGYRVLQCIRGQKIDNRLEINEIEEGLSKQNRITIKEFIKEMKKRSGYLSFLLMIFIMSFQQLSGINALVFYASPIIKHAGFNDPNLIALVSVGLMEFITCVAAFMIIDLCGRKILFVLSALMMAVSSAGLGTYFYLVLSDCSQCSSLAVVCMIVFIVGFSLGLGPLPFLVVAEIIPVRIRGVLISIVSAVMWFWGTIVTGFYLQYSQFVGSDVAWWTFAGLNIFVALFVAFLLPESKGKPLESIELELQHDYSLCAWK